MSKQDARKIVNAILKDILGRKGIGNELRLIEPEILREMKLELVGVVLGLKINP